MKLASPTTLPPTAKATAPVRVRRSRHHPRGWAVLSGALLLMLAFLAFVSFTWFAGELLLTGDRLKGICSLASLVVFGAARVLAFLNNRHLTCTLCHGTLLHEKRCRKHADATRVPGLSHRAATVLSTLCTGGFRCMYCGTPYRLRK